MNIKMGHRRKPCVCVWGGVGGQGKLLEEVVQNYFEVQGGL